MNDSTETLKACVVCGTKFEPRKPTQIYCTNTCQKTAERERAKKTVKKCKGCGKEFFGPSPKLYCSDECRRAYITPDLPSVKCPICGLIFDPRNTIQRFCSAECRTLSMAVNRFVIFERDEFRCAYCGKSSIEDGVKLRPDHIFPHSKGGKNTADNIITSCEQCNLEKSARIMSEDIQNRLLTLVSERNRKSGIKPQQVIEFTHQN